MLVLRPSPLFSRWGTGLEKGQPLASMLVASLLSSSFLHEGLFWEEQRGWTYSSVVGSTRIYRMMNMLDK